MMKEALKFFIKKLNEELKGLELVIEGVASEYGNNCLYLKKSDRFQVVGAYVIKGDLSSNVIIYKGPSGVVKELKKITEKNVVSLRYKLTDGTPTNEFNILEKGRETVGHKIDGIYFKDPIKGMLEYKKV